MRLRLIRGDFYPHRLQTPAGHNVAQAARGRLLWLRRRVCWRRQLVGVNGARFAGVRVDVALGAVVVQLCGIGRRFVVPLNNRAASAMLNSFASRSRLTRSPYVSFMPGIVAGSAVSMLAICA